MACVRSDTQGNFLIKGWEKEFSDIDPYLKVYHDCNDKILFGMVEKVCLKFEKTFVFGHTFLTISLFI